MRQSGDVDAKIKITTRLRKGPYWHLAVKAGAWAFATYNHTYHPRAYVKPEDGGLMKEYEYITQHVTMWDVAVERQIQVKGPDAAAFVDRVITRDVYSKLPVNKARYVIPVQPEGWDHQRPRAAEDRGGRVPVQHLGLGRFVVVPGCELQGRVQRGHQRGRYLAGADPGPEVGAADAEAVRAPGSWT